MPCLFAILALAAPRLLIVLLFLLTHWFRGVFHAPFASPIWPVVLGFIFLPTTLLWYVAVQHWFGGHWTPVAIVGLVIALVVDVSPASSRRRMRRD